VSGDAPVAVAILAKHLGDSTDRAIASARRRGLPVHLGLTHDDPAAAPVDVAAVAIGWRDDFAAARNDLLARVSAPFVLWLDSDEEIFAFPQLDWARYPEDLFFVRTQFSAALTPRVHVRMHRNLPQIGWADRIHERLTRFDGKPPTTRFLNSLVLRHHGYEDAETIGQKHRRNSGIAADALAAGDGSYGARIALARATAAAGQPATTLWLDCYRMARAGHDPAAQPSTVGVEPALRLCMSGLTRPAEQLVAMDPLNTFLQLALIAARRHHGGAWDEERIAFLAECLANGIFNVYENFPTALLGADAARIRAHVEEWVSEWGDGMDAKEVFDPTLAYRQKEGVSREAFDGDLLLMEAETQKVVLVNPVAGTLFDLLELPNTLDDLAAVLAEAFPEVPPESHRDSAAAMLREFLGAGLIIPAT